MAMTDEQKRLQKNYRDMLKRNHFCRECLRKDAYTLAGRVYCAECTEKRKRQRHFSSTRESLAKDCVIHKTLRDKRRLEHKCPRCGKQLEQSDTHVYCTICRNRSRKASNKYRAKKGANFPRGENGICWQCNKNPAIDGKRLCAQCYAKMLKIRAVIPKQPNHPWKKMFKGGNYART